MSATSSPEGRGQRAGDGACGPAHHRQGPPGVRTIGRGRQRRAGEEQGCEGGGHGAARRRENIKGEVLDKSPPPSPVSFNRGGAAGRQLAGEEVERDRPKQAE